MAKAATLFDNFDDNSRDTGKWDLYSAGSGVTVSETNQRLQIALVNASGDNEAGYDSADAALDLTESHVFVRLVQSHNTAHAGAYSNFLIYSTDLNNSYTISVYQTDLSIARIVGGSFSLPFSTTYSSTTHAWFRIRESGGTIFFDTAPSTAANPPGSGEWVNRHSESAGFAITAVAVRLLGGTDTAGTSPGTVIWDGFNTSTTPVVLTPSLVTNTNTFHAPTVTRGAVTLTPSLFTNTQTFHAATVSSTYALTPGLFTNGQTFYSATVSPGAVTITAPLTTNTQTFYTATVSTTYGLLPGLLTNGQTFFGPTITVGSVTLTPSLFTNTQTFFAPTVTLDNAPQTLEPALYANDNVFFSPTIEGGQTQTFTSSGTSWNPRWHEAAEQTFELPKAKAKKKAKEAYRVVAQSTYAEQLAPTIAPFAPRLSSQLLPPANAVQFDKLVRDIEALRALYTAYYQALEEDDIEVLLLAS